MDPIVAAMSLTLFRITFSTLLDFGLEPVFATALVVAFRAGDPGFKLAGGFDPVGFLPLEPAFESPAFVLVNCFAFAPTACFFVLMRSLSFYTVQLRYV
jgi:hypothetical protein